jgi:hypothetical protein
MDLLIPKTISLTASTITEAADSEWASGTPYALNATVKVSTALPTSSVTYRYKSLVGPNSGNAPASSPTKWLNLGPSERWQIFDDKIKSSSAHSSPLEFSVTAASGTAVLLMGLSASTVRCVVVNNSNSATITDTTITLSGRKDVTFDITSAASQTITITITGTGTVSCGLFRVCTVFDLGATKLGAGARVVDYSRKATDPDTGVTELTPGNVAKAINVNLRVPLANVNAVFRKVSAYQGKLVGFRDGVTAETSATDAEPLLIFGWIVEFENVFEGATYSLCSLEAQGII